MKRQHYKHSGRPPYSPEIIRYALLLRYTSPQAYYTLLRGKFPFPSFTLLQKLQRGGWADFMNAAKVLLENGSISSDIVLMANEIYLQQGTQFHSGEWIGVNENGELFKGVVAFMINGLRDTVPIIARACPEVSIKGEWLASEFMKCITDLSNAGFKVRGIVTDNHSTNVSAFKILLNNNNGDKKDYFIIPGSCDKTSIFLILSIC